LADGGDLANLVPMTESEPKPADMPPLEFDESERPANGSASDQSPTWTVWADRVVHAEPEWYTKPPERRSWLLRDQRTDSGVLPLGKVGMLAGAGGAGKTMALTQLAVAVATGTPWLGVLEVAAQGNVLLILGEEDAEEVRRRLYRAYQAAPRG